MNHISIIIVHYNTKADTIECLESLQKLTTKDFEYQVIIVDNGSKELLTLPNHLQSKKTELLRSDANLGFTGGNNLGIKHAIQKYNSDFVLLLNSDTYVHPDSLSTLLAYAKAHPEVGLINPKIYFAKGFEFHDDSYSQTDRGKVIWFAGGTIDWSDVVSFHRGVDEVDRGHFDDAKQTDFITGCCMLIRREVLETVGLLNKKLFLYWEDVDYSLRVKSHGYELAIEPAAVIWHKNAGSSDGASSNVSTYYQTRNRLYLAFTRGNATAKISATKLAARFLRGSQPEKKAVTDVILNRMGKQPVI